MLDKRRFFVNTAVLSCSPVFNLQNWLKITELGGKPCAILYVEIHQLPAEISCNPHILLCYLPARCIIQSIHNWKQEMIQVSFSITVVFQSTLQIPQNTCFGFFFVRAVATLTHRDHVTLCFLCHWTNTQGPSNKTVFYHGNTNLTSADLCLLLITGCVQDLT